MNTGCCTPKPKSLQDKLLARAEIILNDADLLSVSAATISSLLSDLMVSKATNDRLEVANETLKKSVLAFAAEQPVNPLHRFSPPNVDLTEWASARRDAARYRFLRARLVSFTIHPAQDVTAIDFQVDIAMKLPK